jgi:hypothetical protein
VVAFGGSDMVGMLAGIAMTLGWHLGEVFGGVISGKAENIRQDVAYLYVVSNSSLSCTPPALHRVASCPFVSTHTKPSSLSSCWGWAQNSRNHECLTS